MRDTRYLTVRCARIRARVDSVEDWLADFTGRATGFDLPEEGNQFR